MAEPSIPTEAEIKAAALAMVKAGPDTPLIAGLRSLVQTSPWLLISISTMLGVACETFEAHPEEVEANVRCILTAAYVVGLHHGLRIGDARAHNTEAKAN